jgi:methionyl-tRNA formyltransferase
MDYRSLRIVFMGTPDFAKASLEKLVDSGCQIVGVITAPDRPAGRGMKLQQSAVKEYAFSKGLNILQPEKLKNPAFLDELGALKADLQIVVAFRMLPELVWNMPPLGTINVHGSLLPDYRGAAPINWAVINGEKETGVTTFKLKQEIDTGNILMQEKMSIGENETAGEVHDRMKILGADLLLKTIQAVAEDKTKEIPQDNISREPKHAPKIFTETCRINWNSSAEKIHNQVRGLSPYPAAFTTLHEKTFKIYQCTYELRQNVEDPGAIKIEDGKMAFACANGYVYPQIVQAEGKKKMGIDDFLRGYRINQ